MITNKKVDTTYAWYLHKVVCPMCNKKVRIPTKLLNKTVNFCGQSCKAKWLKLYGAKRTA